MPSDCPPRSLFVIQDGLGDHPLECLGGQTPLEAATTPHMDRLLERGCCGLMDIIAPGVTVGTDQGHLALFGQDLDQVPARRGPLEAAGLGIVLQPGEVALRCNFATIEDGWKIRDRRAGRIRQGALELAQALNRIDLGDGIEIEFRAATEHRGVLILRGEGLSHAISDSDPGPGQGLTVQRVQPCSPDAASRRTADAVDRFVLESYRLLRDHPVNRARLDRGEPPANVVLTRGAGSSFGYRRLVEEWGIRAACVSGECTVLGIARLAGVEVITSARMTANLDTDLEEKARRTLEALQDFELVYLHLKGCDIAGHDRRPRAKVEFIERTDAMIGRIVEALGEDSRLRFIFAADHSTPSDLGEHSADPVPVFLSGAGIEPDQVTHYGESPCRQGRLGRLLSHDFLTQALPEIPTGV